MKEASLDLLPAAIMILVIITLGVFVSPEEDSEVETPTYPLHIQLEVPDIKSPDVSYAFEVAENVQKAYTTMSTVFEIKEQIDSLKFDTVDMILTDIGSYYVTNYCPAECGGSWATSSGATCHRSSYEDRLTIPTTCAIDLSVGDYSDLYYIPAFDRVFIAEDTGSGVKGKWLDLFYEDYSDVVNFPVGYYEVYSVEYVYGEVPASNYSIQPYLKTDFEDALAEYNYEPPVSITLIHKNIFPWTDCNTVIVTIVRECWDEEPINVPYI